MYCICSYIVCLSGIILSSWQSFLKKWNPFVKDNSHVEQMIMRSSQTSWKDVLHCFHKVQFLCKTIASYLNENKTVLLSKSFQCALIITLFWQQSKMLITHCMLCRNLIFWKTYCMIEGRLHQTTKERTNTFLRKERCMFRGLLYIL